MRDRQPRLGFAVILLAACLLALPGCGKDADEYLHIYTVRARVTQLPDGSPGSAFMAHHEPLGDYVSANGSIGMASMIMPFQTPDPAVLDAIEVGDIVEITFGESFEPEVRQGVIRISKLPGDTQLDFGPEIVRPESLTPEQ